MPDPHDQKSVLFFRLIRIEACCVGILIGLFVCIIGAVFLCEYFNKQSQVVRKISSLGGSVLYDYEYDFREEAHRIPGFEKAATPHLIFRVFCPDLVGNVVYVQLESNPQTPFSAWTLNGLDLESLHHLQHIILEGSGFHAENIQFLYGLKNLKVLVLKDTALKSEDVGKLQAALIQCEIHIENSPGSSQ